MLCTGAAASFDWFSAPVLGQLRRVKHCPNTDCPDRGARGRPAEYRDDVVACASCGTLLVRGEAAAKSRETRPFARLGVSIAVPIGVLLAGRIPLPGVDVPAFYSGPAGGSSVGILDLGLAPLLAAFLLVELSALVVPALRRRRLRGPGGRPLLRRLSLILALLLAGVQAFGMATFLESMEVVAEPGWGFRLLTILTRTAATAALFALTEVIDRWGLGNGFSVLILASTLPELWLAGADVQRAAGAGLLPLASVLLLLVVLGSFAAATLMILVPRKRRGRGQPLEPEKLEPFTIRLPACGALPIGAPAWVFALPAQLAAFLPAPDSPGRTALGLVLGAAAALLFAWLFNRPTRVMAIWQRVRGESLAGSLAVAKLREAMFKSVIFILAVIVGSALLAASVHGVDLPSGLAVAIDTAILLDLVREWRARGDRPDLVPVWPVQRVYAVDAARHALERAGIEVFPRGLHHRTMLQFFGPYVAIDLLVPADRAEQARRVLGELLLPD
jgi:preprotein translocase subunit SecY